MITEDWQFGGCEKIKMGANAVVNIVSYYQKTKMASATEFECHVGIVIATVWLKGDSVKIADE